MRNCGFYYIGNKSYVAPLIARYLAENRMEFYIEPFGGSFGCGFELLETGVISKAVLIDANPDVINFWKTVAYDIESLIRALDSVQEYIITVGMTKRIYVAELEATFTKPHERAAVHWWVRHLNKGACTINHIAPAQCRKAETTELMRYHQALYLRSALLSSKVEILQENYRCAENYNAPCNFMLIDPPYKNVDNAMYYGTSAGFPTVEEVGEFCANLSATWLLTYNEWAGVSNLLPEYRTETFQFNNPLNGALRHETFTSSAEILELQGNTILRSGNMRQLVY